MAAETSTQAQRAESVVSTAASTACLSTLTYRSRTVAPMSELELHRLLRAAQLRNHAEGVTGMLVYDSGWIFQQLEGPAPGLDRIWDSIRRDTRHVGIEVLSDARTNERHFPDWDLKLSVHGANAGRVAQSPSESPPELISKLYRGEQPTHLLVSAWLPSVAEPLLEAAETLKLTRATLSTLISSVIIPRLCAALPRPGRALPPPCPQTMALARLLLGPDPQAALVLVKAAHAAGGSLGTLVSDVLEPAARDLGDLWQADDCSEFDVTLGLLRLQAILRELGVGSPRARHQRQPQVLVVPQPGEDHLLGASLDAEMLWRAGWNPRLEFPATSIALDALVAGTWIDALDLSLSPSLRRENRLASLRETIAHARLASLNRDLVVVVSGRVFDDHGDPAHAGDVAREVGADASFTSASQAEATLLEALRLPPPRLHEAPAVGSRLPATAAGHGG